MHAKYFKGWLKPQAFSEWEKECEKAQLEKFELCVFKIPSNKFGSADSNSISDIEKLLQDKHGK